MDNYNLDDNENNQLNIVDIYETKAYKNSWEKTVPTYVKTVVWFFDNLIECLI